MKRENSSDGFQPYTAAEIEYLTKQYFNPKPKPEMTIKDWLKVVGCVIVLAPLAYAGLVACMSMGENPWGKAPSAPSHQTENGSGVYFSGNQGSGR